MDSIYNFTQSLLKDKFIREGFPGYLGLQVFEWVYGKEVEDFDSMTNISKDLRDYLKKNFYFSEVELEKKETSSDGTKKFLLRLEDGFLIETVLIPELKRTTLCVSTQVGCKFGCRFCESAKGGFKRNLETSEIINQYIFVQEHCNSKITNIVFMGIGEPLDNFSNVVDSILILTDPKGIGLGRRKISISTCGLPEKIKKLADLRAGAKLSLSLHAANDNKRSLIMPVSRKYPLAKVKDALIYFINKESYPISFEYVMIKGFNIADEDVDSLAKFLRGIKAKVNLIPYNGKEDKFKAPNNIERIEFRDKLKSKKIFASLRRPRGQDIQAACGQLKASFPK